MAVQSRKIQIMLNCETGKSDFAYVGGTSVSHGELSRGAPYNAHGSSR